MMRYLKPAILWALCAFSIQPNTFAQSIPPLTYLGIEQGLSNNAVTSIYQDYNGFMWFGTYDGLNRYDGYNFTIYRNEFNDTNSVADNRVNECRRRILLLLQRPAGLEAGRSSPATRYR
ncbi:MAG TPA: two-component regulator propeller domain-containing protein, partial [Chitinophaga sp.]|uniref:ligand-binding sensor domain-containing protein n=1 Tax=Chitinophaga sp. TaxID=1869181 RepID=UPI002F94125E